MDIYRILISDNNNYFITISSIENNIVIISTLMVENYLLLYI